MTFRQGHTPDVGAMTFIQPVEKSVCVFPTSWKKHGRQLMWSVTTFRQAHTPDVGGAMTFIQPVDNISKSVFRISTSLNELDSHLN
jgi:hypothetical protein